MTARICVESNEGKNPSDSYLLNLEDTMLISEVPTSKEISIVPGEQLPFPHIFSNRQFGYRVELEVKLSPVKCFDQ